MEWEIIRIVMGIIAFSAFGILFLVKQENPLARILSRGKYDQKKTSQLLGIGFLGIATAIIPILISALLENNWFLLLSVAILLALITYVWLFELSGKLK